MRPESSRFWTDTSYARLETRVPKDLLLRHIWALVDEAFATLETDFRQLFSATGRSPVPLEKLMRTRSLHVLYTTRSERALIEQLNYNLRLRWFVGSSMDDPLWHPTTLTKNQDRLLDGEGAKLDSLASRRIRASKSLQQSNGERLNRTLRVCHLIGSLRYGGAERQVVNILNHLPFGEKHLVVLEARSSDGLYGILSGDIVCTNAPVSLRSLATSVARVAKVLRHWRIDVLHTHMFWPNFYGAIAGRLACVPVVITSEHGKNHWKRWVHRWVEQHVISPLVDMRVCASEDIRNLRHRSDGIPEAKLVCVSNGTELRTIRKKSRIKLPTVIGSVGRFVEAKDYCTLIKAAALLRADGEEFRLCLVGDGPERTEIESAVAAYDLGSLVELTGFQQDISSWLERFDVFVMSSIREGQPLALLEAMAHGLPIVATSVGGIPSTVADGVDALLVDPQRPELLAEALRQLLRDPERRVRLGASARERAERDFSIEAVAARYAQLYQDLWDRKHENRA